jgi:hypothetical protein
MTVFTALPSRKNDERTVRGAGGSVDVNVAYEDRRKVAYRRTASNVDGLRTLLVSNDNS